MSRLFPDDVGCDLVVNVVVVLFRQHWLLSHLHATHAAHINRCRHQFRRASLYDVQRGNGPALFLQRKSIYIVLFWPRWYTQSDQAWITQFYLQITPCLPFLRERSPDVTTTATKAVDIQLQLIFRPRKDERLSWPSWLSYSGWFTHISGHPSATCRGQDSESTPAKDRRSTAGPRNQPTTAGL